MTMEKQKRQRISWTSVHQRVSASGAKDYRCLTTWIFFPATRLPEVVSRRVLYELKIVIAVSHMCDLLCWVCGPNAVRMYRQNQVLVGSFKVPLKTLVLGIYRHTRDVTDN